MEPNSFSFDMAPEPQNGRAGQPDRWLWLASASLLLVVFLVATWPLASGSAYPIWDAANQYAPSFTLVADFARHGQLLSWNPWTNGGSPDFADPQFGAFSPIQLLFGLVFGATLTGFEWYWLLTWIAGALGMFVLGRSLGAPAWGAVSVSLGFAFSGFFTGHAQHTTILHAYAALPWVVWRLDVALRRSSAIPAIEAGAIWGVSALAGYPGIVIINAGALVLWAIGRAALCSPADWARSAPEVKVQQPPATAAVGRLMRALGLSAVALAVGVCILAPSYIAMLVDGKGFTDRSGPLPREVAVGSNPLEPGALSTFSSPYLAALKRDAAKTMWPRTSISMVSIYTGAVVTWLSLCALILSARSWWRWWLALVGLAALLLALGDALPLRGWAYDWLPPLRYFRHPAIFRGYAMFAAAVLAALASRDLAELLREAARGNFSAGQSALLLRRRLGFAAVGYLTAASGLICDFWVIATMAGPNSSTVIGTTHALIAWGGVALLGTLLLLPPRLNGQQVIPLVLLVLAAYDAVAAARLSEPLMWTRLSSIAQRWHTLRQQHSANLSLTANGLQREFSGSPDGKATGNYNLLLKQPALFGYTPFRNRLHLWWRSDCSRGALPAAATGSNRIWFAPRGDVLEVPVSGAEFQAFCRRAAELGAPPMVIHRRDEMLASVAVNDGGQRPTAGVERLRPARRITTQVIRYTPTILELEVDVPEDGYLVVTDRWARGWQVSVNETPQEMLGGMFIFRAVAVARGHNVISFRFHRFAEPYLLVLSWGLLGVVLLLSGRSVIRSLRVQRRRPSQ